MITKIDFKTAHEIIEKNSDCIILDVREEEEYIQGHAVNAVLLPVDTIDENSILQITKNLQQVLLVYCRTGRRSAIAADKLNEMGYENIYDVGSLAGWPYGLEWNV